MAARVMAPAAMPALSVAYRTLRNLCDAGD
jgi:hypothetical protein